VHKWALIILVILTWDPTHTPQTIGQLLHLSSVLQSMRVFSGPGEWMGLYDPTIDLLLEHNVIHP